MIITQLICNFVQTSKAPISLADSPMNALFVDYP
jgi:hypothetical protein